MNCQILFSVQNKKNAINLPSAELAQIVIMARQPARPLLRLC